MLGVEEKQNRTQHTHKIEYSSKFYSFKTAANNYYKISLLLRICSNWNSPVN